MDARLDVGFFCRIAAYGEPSSAAGGRRRPPRTCRRGLARRRRGSRSPFRSAAMRLRRRRRANAGAGQAVASIVSPAWRSASAESRQSRAGSSRHGLSRFERFAESRFGLRRASELARKSRLHLYLGEALLLNASGAGRPAALAERLSARPRLQPESQRATIIATLKTWLHHRGAVDALIACGRGAGGRALGGAGAQARSHSQGRTISDISPPARAPAARAGLPHSRHPPPYRERCSARAMRPGT